MNTGKSRDEKFLERAIELSKKEWKVEKAARLDVLL